MYIIIQCILKSYFLLHTCTVYNMFLQLTASLLGIGNSLGRNNGDKSTFAAFFSGDLPGFFFC